MSRQRKPSSPRKLPKYTFHNPYPQMSEPEARVHLFLEGLGVPFSWRKFDGQALAPNFTYLMPSFTPEFTLTEYKVVILIIGSYWGTIPGVLDNNSLAAVLLEEDGWKVAMLWQNDVINDTAKAVFGAVPQLTSTPIKGPPKTDAGVYDKTYLERARQFARSLAFRNRVFIREGDWGDRNPLKRQPKRGSRLEPTGIERTELPEDTSQFGKSRLRGTAPTPARRKRFTNTYARPARQKDTSK